MEKGATRKMKCQKCEKPIKAGDPHFCVKTSRYCLRCWEDSERHKHMSLVDEIAMF